LGPDERESLMRIATKLYLTDEQIDRLLLAASRSGMIPSISG